MPFFSIVIPSYNNAEHIPSCLDSLLSQSYCDWEAIIVDDGSIDDSLAVLQRYASNDSRITVIDKQENEGPHLARCTGVEHVHGEYVLFLDSDDEMMPEALSSLHGELKEDPVDILHYGAKVEVCKGMDRATGWAFEEHANKPFEMLVGEEILVSVFAESGAYMRDWRLWQRAFKTEITKKAFASMDRKRLGRAQDGYEYFVVASLAQSERTKNDIVAYRYYLGRGITSASKLEVSGFKDYASQYRDVYEATLTYAQSRDSQTLIDCANGFKKKLIEALANEWHERINDQDKIEAAAYLAEIVGKEETACELLRFSRDAVYEALANGRELFEDAPFRAWMDYAANLVEQEASIPARYAELLQATNSHIEGIFKRERWSDMAESPVKILVCSHKDAEYFDSSILQPIQVGSALSSNRLHTPHHDDQGDSISSLNPMYCELTAQYWAWKNLDAEYYGFCHYRRYFNFSDVCFKENAYGEVIDHVPDAAAQAKYGLTDESITDALDGCDIVVTEIKNISSFPEHFRSTTHQYDSAPHLHVEDFELICSITKEMYPEYSKDVDSFASGNEACFCNMFIMSKPEFNAYCEWLFPILDVFMDCSDMSHYSKEALRTPGHLAERLLNIYIQHQRRTRADLKLKEVQCVRFEETNRVWPHRIPTYEHTHGREIIPVVFAADNNYVPMLTTTIYSMLKNASSDAYYDVVVLGNGISWDNVSLMKTFFSQFENASLSFVDVAARIAEYDLSTNNPHIGIETYYRFLIQDILPYDDKALYLDSDLIIEGDVAELYNLDLETNYLAAVTDLDFLGNLNIKTGTRMSYAKKTLKMIDPYKYFQAGVLLLNLAELRELHTVREWLELATNTDYIYNDQDILNMECQGRVLPLDYAWNVMIDCDGRIGRIFSFAPADVYDAFLASRNDARIVHYAGFEKPWKPGQCDKSELYWKYARDTPFYERLLSGLSSDTAKANSIPCHERAVSDTSPIRRVVDPIMPIGSRRREAAKYFARKARGRQ